jgi:hypothetical protein
MAARTTIPGADFPQNLRQNTAKLEPKRAGGGSVQLRRGEQKARIFGHDSISRAAGSADIAPHSLHPIDGGTHDGAVMRG